MTAVVSPGSGETLQQRLEAASKQAWRDWHDGKAGLEGTGVWGEESWLLHRLVPVVESLVVAARVGTTERIAEKIEAEAKSGLWPITVRHAYTACADLARSVGTETDG